MRVTQPAAICVSSPTFVCVMQQREKTIDELHRAATELGRTPVSGYSDAAEGEDARQAATELQQS
jgi:hypothetical protein